MKLRRFDHLLKRAAAVRRCDHAGCGRAGDCRAPRNRNTLREMHPAHLNQYHWFCQDHARTYNMQWNYYADMNEDEIVHARYNDMFWQRPTVPFGKGAHRKVFQQPLNSFDKYGILRQAVLEEQSLDPHAVFFPGHAPESYALRALEITQPTTLAIVKSVYREKAKKYHPDLNGGCQKAEETLKRINNAYQILKKAF